VRDARRALTRRAPPLVSTLPHRVAGARECSSLAGHRLWPSGGACGVEGRTTCPYREPTPHSRGGKRFREADYRSMNAVQEVEC